MLLPNGALLFIAGAARLGFRQVCVEGLLKRRVGGREPADKLVRQRQSGAQQRSLHALALAGLVPVAQRGDHAQRRKKARAHIDVGRPDVLGRVAVRTRGDRAGPGHALDHHVVAAVLAERPFLSERDVFEKDQAGADRRKRVVRQPVSRHVRRLERNQYHVCQRHQPFDNRSSAGARDIDAEAALAPVQHREALAFARDNRHLCCTESVAFARLHLDHLCSHVREEQAADRHRHCLCELHDADPLQRTRQRPVIEARTQAHRSPARWGTQSPFSHSLPKILTMPDYLLESRHARPDAVAGL